MSLIIFMEVKNGLILAGDSRLSSKDDPFWHVDTAHKVFECSKKYGIAYHGAADISGEPMDKILNRFLLTVDPSSTINDIFEALKHHMESNGSPRTIFYILGYDKGNRQILKLDLIHHQHENISASRYGTGGEDDLAWSIMDDNYVPNLSCHEATKFITSIFKKTCSANSKIGGPVDILFITVDNGTHWLMRK